MISSLIQETQLFVDPNFKSCRLRDFPYHNLHHTWQVVGASTELAQKMKLGIEEMEILILAAWLHDTGYSVRYQGHEAASQRIALNFLSQRQFPQENISVVLRCIQATEMPQKPRSQIEQIICDADLAHLASPHFLTLQNKLRLEWDIYLKKVYPDEEWLVESLAFLNDHHYHSPYARDNWEEGKKQNSRLLQKQMAS